MHRAAWPATVGYSPRGRRGLDTTEWLSLFIADVIITNSQQGRPSKVQPPEQLVEAAAFTQTFWGAHVAPRAPSPPLLPIPSFASFCKNANLQESCKASALACVACSAESLTGAPHHCISAETPSKRDSAETPSKRDSAETTSKRDSAETTSKRDSAETTSKRDSAEIPPARETVQRQPARETVQRQPARETVQRYPARETVQRYLQQE